MFRSTQFGDAKRCGFRPGRNFHAAPMRTCFIKSVQKSSVHAFWPNPFFEKIRGGLEVGGTYYRLCTHNAIKKKKNLETYLTNLSRSANVVPTILILAKIRRIKYHKSFLSCIKLFAIKANMQQVIDYMLAHFILLSRAHQYH